MIYRKAVLVSHVQQHFSLYLSEPTTMGHEGRAGRKSAIMNKEVSCMLDCSISRLYTSVLNNDLMPL